MRPLIALALLLANVAACGGSSWSPTYATDHLNVDVQIMLACDTDAGTCSAAPTYELARANVCADENELFVHRVAVPDAGVQCRPTAP